MKIGSKKHKEHAQPQAHPRENEETSKGLAGGRGWGGIKTCQDNPRGWLIFGCNCKILSLVMVPDAAVGEVSQPAGPCEGGKLGSDPDAEALLLNYPEEQGSFYNACNGNISTWNENSRYLEYMNL